MIKRRWSYFACYRLVRTKIVWSSEVRSRARPSADCRADDGCWREPTLLARSDRTSAANDQPVWPRREIVTTTKFTIMIVDFAHLKSDGCSSQWRWLQYSGAVEVTCRWMVPAKSPPNHNIVINIISSSGTSRVAVVEECFRVCIHTTTATLGTPPPGGGCSATVAAAAYRATCAGIHTRDAAEWLTFFPSRRCRYCCAPPHRRNHRPAPPITPPTIRWLSAPPLSLVPVRPNHHDTHHTCNDRRPVSVRRRRRSAMLPSG